MLQALSIGCEGKPPETVRICEMRPIASPGIDVQANVK